MKGSRTIVAVSDVIATSVADVEKPWYRGRVVVRTGDKSRQIVVENAYGASPERAIAFAMRQMADEILKEFPRQEEPS